MTEMLLDTLFDLLRMLPILLAVYLLIEFIQQKLSADCLSGGRAGSFGPLLGAALGCIPQCGFSAAAVALYRQRLVGAGTLVAVFLATSDEAVPILLSHPETAKTVVWLILSKFCIAVVAGYAVGLIFGRPSRDGGSDAPAGAPAHTHRGAGGVWGIVISALRRTLKIALFLLVTLLCINLIVYWVGEDSIGRLLLQGSVFQPFLTALIGLIPGCAVSVFLTELFVNGTLTFGSAIAGLCSGAGFGYLLLFGGRQDKRALRRAFAVLGSVYLTASISGLLLNLWA